MGKFRQCLTELSAHDTIMAGYYSLTFLFYLLCNSRMLGVLKNTRNIHFHDKIRIFP